MPIIVRICISAMVLTFVFTFLAGSVDSYDGQRQRLLNIAMVLGVITIETFLISIWMN